MPSVNKIDAPLKHKAGIAQHYPRDKDGQEPVAPHQVGQAEADEGDAQGQDRVKALGFQAQFVKQDNRCFGCQKADDGADDQLQDQVQHKQAGTAHLSLNVLDHRGGQNDGPWGRWKPIPIPGCPDLALEAACS